MSTRTRFLLQHGCRFQLLRQSDMVQMPHRESAPSARISSFAGSGKTVDLQDAALESCCKEPQPVSILYCSTSDAGISRYQGLHRLASTPRPPFAPRRCSALQWMLSHPPHGRRPKAYESINHSRRDRDTSKGNIILFYLTLHFRSRQKHFGIDSWQEPSWSLLPVDKITLLLLHSPLFQLPWSCPSVQLIALIVTVGLFSFCNFRLLCKTWNGGKRSS